MMRIITIHLFCLLLLLSGCKSENNKTSLDFHSIVDHKETKKTRLWKPPAFSTFRYPEKDKRRSPFVAKQFPLIEQTTLNHHAQATIDQFSLETLKFVGVLKEETKIWALIREPNGNIIHVKRGDSIGKSHGLVLTIEEDHITIEETTLQGRSLFCIK